MSALPPGESSQTLLRELETTGVRLYPHTLDTDAFEYFSKYNYGLWQPPQSRRDWIRQWTGPGEFLDIGCGGYPATMDVPSGGERGIGADIAPEAARRYRNYFREFYLFNIERIRLGEVPELAGRFNTVVMSETLEHFREPLAALRKAAAFLHPGGRLLVTYPNASSFAQLVDYYGHGGRWHRFRDFHRSHIYLVRKERLETLFAAAGLDIAHFDFRPSDIGIEGVPPESNRAWRMIAASWPSFLGHQFFYVLTPAVPSSGGAHP
ncbi:MAG: class I SAM-dependent methyltransferase [bacterium]|nr:class I SAM-dependent methyltransferase [bacterium]